MKRIAFIFLFLSVLSLPTSVFSQDDKSRKSPIAIEEQVTPEMNVVDNKLFLNNAPVGKNVEIYSIIGVKIKDIKITNSVMEEKLVLPRSIYILKMDGMVRKVIIK